MAIKNKLDNRQSRQRETLDQVSNSVDLRLDSILNLINDELTPPVRLRAYSSGSRTFYVDSSMVQTVTIDGTEGHKRKKTIPPISDTIPNFAGGTLTIPSSSGGTITSTGFTFTSGAVYTLTVSDGFFLKMFVSLAKDGTITLSFGTQGATELAATVPASNSSVFPVGMVVIKNEGGIIRNVLNEHIYQFTGNTNAGVDANIVRINKSNHSFIIGDVLYLNGSVYSKAIATTATTANVVGIVSKIIDINNFELTTDGKVSGISSQVLTVGSKYYLSGSVEGQISLSPSTIVGEMSVELGVATSISDFVFSPKLGLTVGQENLLPNLRTQVNLTGSSSVSSTTVVHNVSGYDAGELVGWIYLNADVDYRFYIQAQFVKKADGTDFSLSPQITGDIPPLGFSMTVTPVGVIEVNLPAMAGWVSGNIIYALNAPAIGTSFPLTVNTSNITTNYREVTSTYSLTINDYMVVASGSSAYAITLPLVTGSGVSYVIKSKMNTGVDLTVGTNGSQLIDSSSTKILASNEVLKVTSSFSGSVGRWIVESLTQDVAAVSSPTFTGTKITGLTASRGVQTDVNKNLVSAPIAIYNTTVTVTSPAITIDASTGNSFIHAGSVASRGLIITNLSDGQTININIQGTNGNVISWTTTGLIQKNGITYSQVMTSANSIYTLVRLGTNVFISSLHGFG